MSLLTSYNRKDFLSKLREDLSSKPKKLSESQINSIISVVDDFINTLRRAKEKNDLTDNPLEKVWFSTSKMTEVFYLLGKKLFFKYVIKDLINSGIDELNFESYPITVNDFGYILSLLKNNKSIKDIKFGLNDIFFFDFLNDEIDVYLNMEVLMKLVLDKNELSDSDIKKIVTKVQITKEAYYEELDEETGFSNLIKKEINDYVPEVEQIVRYVFNNAKDFVSALSLLKDTNITHFSLTAVNFLSLYVRGLGAGLKDSKIEELNISYSNADYYDLEAILKEITKGDSFNLKKIIMTEPLGFTLSQKDQLINLQKYIPEGNELSLEIISTMDTRTFIKLKGFEKESKLKI